MAVRKNVLDQVGAFNESHRRAAARRGGRGRCPLLCQRAGHRAALGSSDRAVLVTPAALSERIVRECDAVGVRRVWLYRATGAGAVSPGALKLCQARCIPVVAGECPFMFFSGTQWPHRLHGCCRKIFGTYPK